MSFELCQLLSIMACVFLLINLHEEVLLRYVDQTEEQKKILMACHVHPPSAHMSRTCTLSRIKERFMHEARHGERKSPTLYLIWRRKHRI